MKQTLILIGAVFLLVLPLAFSDTHENDLTIEEFMQLDNETLNTFNETLVNIEETDLIDYYIFQYTIYQPYTYYYNIDEDLGTYEETTLIKKQTKLDYFSCPKENNCTTLYNEFIEDYKAWWFIYYTDLKADYG